MKRSTLQDESDTGLVVLFTGLVLILIFMAAVIRYKGDEMTKIGNIKQVYVVFKEQDVEGEYGYVTYEYTKELKRLDYERFKIEGSFISVLDPEDMSTMVYPSEIVLQTQITYWDTK